MQSNHIWLGDQPLTHSAGKDGHYVEIEGERFYRISHYDAMDDFFILCDKPLAVYFHERRPDRRAREFR